MEWRKNNGKVRVDRAASDPFQQGEVHSATSPFPFSLRSEAGCRVQHSALNLSDARIKNDRFRVSPRRPTLLLGKLFAIKTGALLLAYPKSPMIVLTPDYTPPTTLSQDLNRRLKQAVLGSHVAVVDKDVTLPEGFFQLPERFPDADIIGVDVIPSSLLFRIWERLSFWIMLKPRVRDCAVIYKTRFLLDQNGFPESETPGTILQRKATRTVVSDLKAVHNQSFNLKHSLKIQIRDGRSRASMRYSFWATLFHSLFRVRPFVFVSFTYYRFRGERFEFGHPW